MRSGTDGKSATDWAQQLIRQVRRWLPEWALVVVLDSTYAVLERFPEALKLAGSGDALKVQIQPVGA